MREDFNRDEPDFIDPKEEGRRHFKNKKCDKRRVKALNRLTKFDKAKRRAQKDKRNNHHLSDIEGFGE